MESTKCMSGVPGLDEILSGGLPSNQMYLLQGAPGTGKTTLAIQFLMEGVRRDQNVLYVTFSETKAELDLVAASHGWDTSQISILELTAISGQESSGRTTLFHPSEIELSRTIKLLLDKIKEVNPARVVFDSVSELRLLADSSLKYRRQMLSLKEFFIGRGATVLLLDDLTTEAGDLHVQSIVHGVLLLEKFRAAYGAERRQFHIVKLRGVAFRGGTHDYIIQKGGLRMFPRLVSSDYEPRYKPETFSSGVKGLDDLLGGGLDRGTSNLILGPAGSGKTTIAVRFAVSAVQRGQKVIMLSFEENLANLFTRAAQLDIDIRPYIESGDITLRKVNPAELTPGQFATLLRESTDEQRSDLVIIDSLNGYIHAMPEQQFLMLQLHELLSYLSNRGVVTIVILAQAGIMGSMQTPLDLTYLADSVIVTRFFEAFGKVKKAISVIKKRTGKHEESLRELKIGVGGISVGPVLEDFAGIFTGVPEFVGDKGKLLKTDR
jgi:circadian clock protein KaiC